MKPKSTLPRAKSKIHSASIIEISGDLNFPKGLFNKWNFLAVSIFSQMCWELCSILEELSRELYKSMFLTDSPPEVGNSHDSRLYITGIDPDFIRSRAVLTAI